MADQAERVILEAEDQVSPVVDKANAGLDRFEKQAESSHGKVIRISDQTRSSVQRLITSLEKQAEIYGKSGVDRLITQRDQLLQRYNREPQAIDAITRSYEKMIAAEEKVAREALAVKAAKEAEEALRKQAESITSFGERVSQFMENPLQGAKGAVTSVMTALGPFGIAVTAGAAVLGTIAASAFEAAKSLGEYGTRVKDAELRTGLTAKEVGQFSFAARAVGQDISIVERLMRGLSQAANDNSNEGEKARATLRGMGIDFHTHDGMEKAYADAKKDVERLQKQLLEPDKPLTKAQAQDLGQQLHTAEATEARRKAALDAVAKGAEQLKEFQRQAAEFEKKGDESELDATGKIYYQRDQLLKQAEKVKASETEIAAIRASADRQAGVLYKKSWEEFEKYADKQDAEKRKRMLALMMPSKEQMKEWEEGFAAQEKIEDIGVQAQREELRRRAGRSQRMAELTGGDHTPVAMSETDKNELAARKEEAAAQQAYQVRLDLAVQLAGIEAERISKEENAAKRSVLAAQAQKDLFTDLAQAQDQFEEKQAQLQQKREQELQSQIDGLQKQAEKLIDVLFTKPANFGKDLLNTIRSAVLKPITQTLGGAVANVLHPIVYGSDGHGGINGMLRGTSKDPVRASTDMNTAATMQNSAVMAGLTAILAAGMGMAAPHVSGGASGVPSISAPSISVPAPVSGSVGVSMPTVSGRSEGASLPGPIVAAGSAPAAVPSVGDLMNLPMSAHAGGGMSPLATILGSGSKGGTSGLYGLFSKGGASKALSNLKGTFWNQDAWNASDSNFWGGVQGVAKSPAAGAAGMMLATSGLFGSRRGTWGGTLEDTAGGALIGEQIGGPWGAAIGAAAGFTAGVVEQLLGIKSPERKAHDDIKSIYGVDIPQNSGTIKQIVQIAQSQFGGNVGVAVRSPSVRQLVMLYSESTGQKMPLSATTPYAGSLVEQGGKLYQQASYQDGQAHVYASNIPTLGGISAGVYPTPGNPNTAGGGGATYMSLNISGADAANFMTGQFVTPQFVTDQAMAAQYSSYGRTQQSANMQLPGLTVA